MSAPETPRGGGGNWAVWLPALLFAGFLAVVAYNLSNPAERVVRSALIGKPLPEFALQAAVPGQPGLARADMADGKVRLLNIFASWCVPCVQEIPMLIRLKGMGADIAGVNVSAPTSSPRLTVPLSSSTRRHSRTCMGQRRCVSC